MNIDRLIPLFKSRNNIRLERNVVVTHDVPSNCVVGGVHAIIIKDLINIKIRQHY